MPSCKLSIKIDSDLAKHIASLCEGGSSVVLTVTGIAAAPGPSETYIENNMRLRTLLTDVCESLTVSQEDLLSNSRVAKISFARSIFCSLAFNRLKIDCESIGKFIGRDRTTVAAAKNSKTVRGPLGQAVLKEFGGWK